MLEVAARPIGGHCSKVLQFSAQGKSGEATLEDVLLRHAVGQDVSRYAREARAAGVMMIPIPTRGMLKRVQGIDTAAAVPGIEEVRITAKTDQLLRRHRITWRGSIRRWAFFTASSSSCCRSRWWPCL